MRLAVVAAAISAATVSGCASGSDLATVDGVAISQGEVLAMRSEQPAVTAPAADLRRDLTTLILGQALASAAEEQFGTVLTDEQVAARSADAPQRYVALFEQIAADPGLGPGLVGVNARFTLVRDDVIPRLLLEQRGSYEAVIRETPELVMRGCVRHILVATAQEADAVLDRLAAGEDFATVAAQVSLDQQSQGGLLGLAGNCLVHHGQLGPEFVAGVMAAPLQVPTGPLASSFGFHVIQVDERVIPTVAEMTADPMAHLDPATANELMGPWFAATVGGADIDVSSSVGEWSAESSTVVAGS
ncbi:MAG: peptidylprolyl isomerase [Actinomycetota bacterium]|nr:peptidylprolyl isomerase [Actinomycetota bacterium]